ncbi:MAG: hypothetical protein KDE51_26255, partial [Anaerolineales bacterium]|nr:hypothetical protein [Anaerolineales bacterium]
FRLQNCNCQQMTLTILTAAILSQWLPAVRPLGLLVVSLIIGMVMLPLVERYLQKTLHGSYQSCTTRPHWRRTIFRAAELVWALFLRVWVLFVGRLTGAHSPLQNDTAHLSTTAVPSTAAVPTPVYPSTCSLLE